MKTKFLFLLPLLALAAPCAGVDFSDEFEIGDDLPDDLNPVDSITIGAEPARSAVISAELPLVGEKYEGLVNQTVKFIWDDGGQGSGDVALD